MRITMKRLLVALFALCCISLPAKAQFIRLTPVNFCEASTALTAAIGLASFTCDTTLPSPLLYSYAYICTYTQGIVWKDDGVNPTATPGTGGTGLTSGNCFWYSGSLANIKFIEQTSGAVVSVALYTTPTP
jgi:hypothetical protein